MKKLCTLLIGALLLTACESIVEEGRPVHRRNISYSDRDPYYRVYYRERAGRTYYRQHYYDDDPVYRARVDSRRYYYRQPASRASVTFGF